jgi:hypothetical protein
MNDALREALRNKAIVRKRPRPSQVWCPICKGWGVFPQPTIVGGMFTYNAKQLRDPSFACMECEQRSIAPVPLTEFYGREE